MMIVSPISQRLPDSLAMAFPSPDGSDRSPTSKACSSSESPGSSSNTPRKNKRKMSEPKKRAGDLGVKRFCPDSPRREERRELEDEEEERGRRGSQRGHEYPPDTPETSPSPESLIPEATSVRDLTVHTRIVQHAPRMPQHSRVAPPPHPVISMPVTPPMTPGRRKPTSKTNRQGSTPDRGSTTHTVTSSTKHHPNSSNNHSIHSRIQQQQHQQPDPRIFPVLPPRVPVIPAHHASSTIIPIPQPTAIPHQIPPPPSPSSSESTNTNTPHKSGSAGSRRQRKNYKNMTRERRVEANARERTRVHTISAAFESLRRAVPSYSYNQRLSKLAILKIACAYIASLGQLTDNDYTPGTGDNPVFAQCVERCTHTIQAEGRTKRKH